MDNEKFELHNMSIKFLDNIINTVVDPIFVKNDKSELVFVNDAFCDMIGVSREDMLGTTLSESLPQDQMIHFFEMDKMVLESGDENVCEELLTGRDGKILTIITKKSRLVDENGNRFLVGIIHDITNRKEIEKEKLLSENKYKIITEQSPIAIEFYDKEGFLLNANRSCLELFGINDSKEIEHFSLFDDPNITDDHKKDLIQGKSIRYQAPFDFDKVKEFNLYHTTKSGQIWLDLTITPTKDVDDLLTGYLLQIQDITENKLITDDLEIAKEIAEKANNAKSRFLSNMSHELRNPMNGIVGLIEFLLETQLDSQQVEYLQIMKNSTSILKNILNDILDLSKIESNKTVIVQEPFDLCKLATDTNALMLPSLKKKNIQIRTSYDVKDANNNSINMFCGDEIHIRQIITNLYGNAIKFTEKGFISLDILGRENKPGIIDCTISITDSGIGMTPDVIDKIFERFVQADDSIKKRYQGTGLGLSIAKGLVELMNGKIYVESTLGKGSKFYCTFPLKIVKSEPILPVKEKTSEAEYLHNSSFSILCVDDDETNRLLLELRLKQSNYVIDIAEDGREAINKVDSAAIQGKQYDIVFMDVNMPMMNGIEATIELRSKGYTMPIIMLTGYAYQEDLKIFLSNGATDRLAKPYEKIDLLAIIKKYLIDNV
jgi:PAS domain S-box-containing protein